MKTEKYGFLGSDVSKGMCNFVLEKGTGEELEPNFQLDDNREGHQTLYALLEIWKDKYGLKKIVIGLESTGGYEDNWYKNLRNKSKNLGLEVFRINPKRIYHEGKTEGRRSIDDGVSAQIIAGYMRKNYGTKDLEPKRVAVESKQQDESNGLKKLFRFIKTQVQQNTRIKNSFEKILYSSMPEILSIKSESYSNWFLELLIKYPNYKEMQSAGIEGLTEISHISKKRAEKILSAISNIVVLDVDENISMVIREHAKSIQNTSQIIKRLKKQLEENAKTDELRSKQIDIITTIKGIATYSALGILLEIDSIDRFDSGGNLVAYWGINPTLKKSGDKAYTVGMSKDGSTYARSLLYKAAENVRNSEPYFQALYNKQIEAGKSYRSAIGVIMSKLTRVIYGMLKSETDFNAGVDVNNQNKKPIAKKTSEKPRKKKERRHQKEYQDAPISSRQKKKRKQKQNALS